MSINYSDKVKKHLCDYKMNTMGVRKKGIFKYNGENIEYDYILPKESKDKNILEYNGNSSKSVLKGIKTHRYFHHLNSSQAMCINFFNPLIIDNSLDLVPRVLGLNGSVKSHEFEKESFIESVGRMRRTSFDFYIVTDSGNKIYFEIKYTENSFGNVNKNTYMMNNYYIDKFNTVYKPVLDSKDVINKNYCDMDNFFRHYQIMRNLIHIDDDSYVVFVYPSDNKKVEQGAELARDKLLNNKWKDHFILITWEELLSNVLHLNNKKDLEDYYINKFKVKYLV